VVKYFNNIRDYGGKGSVGSKSVAIVLVVVALSTNIEICESPLISNLPLDRAHCVLIAALESIDHDSLIIKERPSSFYVIGHRPIIIP